MTRIASTALGLTFLLAGCGGGGTVAGNNQAAAPAQTNDSASAANAAAPANATASAGTPVGPCPFASRGWTATIMPASAPGEQPSVAMNGEVRADAGGRQPMISTQSEQRAPVLVLELLSAPEVEPGDRGWMQNGGVFPDYTPSFTHAAVRCGGAEVTRVPIQPAE